MTPENYGPAPENDYSLEREKYLADLEKLAVQFSKKPHNWQGYGEYDTTILLSAIWEAKNKNITTQELKTVLTPYVRGALMSVAKDTNFNLIQHQDFFSIFNELELDREIMYGDPAASAENQQTERDLLRVGADKIAVSYLEHNLFHKFNIPGYDPKTQEPEKAKEALDYNFKTLHNWLNNLGAGIIEEPIQFQRNYGQLDKKGRPYEPRYETYEPKAAEIIKNQIAYDLECIVDSEDGSTSYLYADKSDQKTQHALKYVVAPRLEMARSLSIDLTGVRRTKDEYSVKKLSLERFFQLDNYTNEFSELSQELRRYIPMALFIEKYHLNDSFLLARIQDRGLSFSRSTDLNFFGDLAIQVPVSSNMRDLSLIILEQINRTAKDFNMLGDHDLKEKLKKNVAKFLWNRQITSLNDLSYDIIPKGLFTPEEMYNLTEYLIQSALEDDSDVSPLGIAQFLQRYDIPKNNVKKIVLDYIISKMFLENGLFSEFNEFVQMFNFTEAEKKEAALKAVVEQMKYYNFDYSDKTAIERIIQKFNLSHLLAEYPLPHPLGEIRQKLKLDTIEQFCELKLNNEYFDGYVGYTVEQGVSVLKEDDFKILNTLPFSWVMGDLIKSSGIDLEDIKNEKDYQKVYEALSDNTDLYQDEENIKNPFEAGASIFGYKYMFEYLNRKRLSLHSGLHAFESIINLYKASGLKPNQFYGNILKQVNMDDREYEAGTAHHHFNELSQTLNTDFASILRTAQEYSDITLLKQLIEVFDSPKKIFESWNNLKRYADLTQILEQKEMIEKLKELKATGKEALYSYVEKLAFHPSSKVDMQAVMRFWQEPESFLDADATHTPAEVHNRKKPSNYIEVPYLDLTAEELRDALVEGDMDNLQVFTPMEIRYKVEVKGKENTVIAKINRKSDPDGVLAGNDTACCMPFGEGKNNVYTFNPNDALFTLQIQRPEGTARTIAQSVLTKDKDIKILIPKIIEQLNQIGEHLTKILPEDILKKSPSYLACDNVEVAANYQQNEYPRLIEMIYRDFFKEYMERFGRMQGLNTGKIPIGQGYSDTLTHLPEELNTFAPLAPVGYSDKLGEKVFMLDLTMKIPVTEKTIFVSPIVKQDEQRPFPYRQGLSALTFEDTLPVAYLEGKAYADNESLMVYLHNLENGLIAKDINNAAKHRPNMSLKYLDADGKMRGYILAYEGELSREEKREKIIYISDLASDKESKTAGGHLIQEFARLYKKNYLEKGNLVPIYAQARETTSYRIIQRQLEKIGRDLGIKIKLEELPTYEKGQDTMHPVMIRPVAG